MSLPLGWWPAVFGVFLVALALNFSVYVYLLAVLRRFWPRPLSLGISAPDNANLPPVTVVVPVYNEEALLGAKLENLLGLAYPPEKKYILVVDGGSTDRSVAVGSEVAARVTAVRLLSAPRAGKIPQLNEALAQVPAHHLVVVTDADARVSSPDALLKTAYAFLSNEGVGVVGGWVHPPESGTIVSEVAYWDKQNRLRYMETVAYSSSIVAGPFYAFWRTLIPRYPEDCIADDVFVSFQSHLRRLRVIYAPDVDVVELRQPQRWWDLLQHKKRKANAYAVELLRVLGDFPAMGRRVKVFYLYKLFQFVLLPWALSGAVACASWLMWAEDWGLVLGGGILLAATVLLASALMVPPPGRRRAGFALAALWPSVSAFVTASLALLANQVLFTFWHQDSCYARLPQRLPQEKPGTA